MIINLTFGGESTITVNGPAGSSISASGGGESISTSIPSGSTSVSFNVHTIASWSVSCTYQSREISKTVSITSFGASESVSFSYATLTVNTYPASTVTISKTGSSSQSKTATGGSAVFYLTEEEFDPSTPWTASCSYTSGSTWSNIGTKIVSAATSYSLTVSMPVPSFTFSWSGGSKTVTPSTATSGNEDQYYYYRNGANWEFYMKVSGTLSFTAATGLDLFLCGGGNNGVNANGYNTCPGGDGGKRRTVSNITISGNNTVMVGSAGNNSSLDSHSSSSGTASKGSAASSQSAGENGGYCFGDSSAKGPDGNSRRVGAGGGHGAYAETDGTSQGSFKTARTNGGSYAAGNGGDSKIDGSTWWCDNGDNATFYGSGGGGAGVYYHTSISERRGKGNPGTGYKGFVAVRNKR